MFKQWLLENQYLFPFLSTEDPLTQDEIKKIKRFKSKETYVKNAQKGGRDTKQAAKSVAMANINGFFLGPEKIDDIYNKVLTIPSKQFSNGIIRSQRYVAFVHTTTTKPNIAGIFTHRLIAYYQMDNDINQKEIMENYLTMMGSVVYQGNYITHAYIDPEYRNLGFNLYAKMREFLLKYYGVTTNPNDDLTSKEFRGAEAKHKWNKYYQSS